MAIEFDANAYSTVPTINAALTLALARRLLTEMPQAILDQQPTRVAASRMRDAAAALREERLKALSRPEKVDTRPFDQGEDSAWGALYGRLEAFTKLDVPEAKSAAELLARVFPSGLAFLTLDYKQQWEESDRLLSLIDDEELGGKLDQLCQPAFLAAVRRAHQVYGDALGLTQQKPLLPEAPAIASALSSLRAAIRFYGRRVVALADEQDPVSIELVKASLSPLLEAQTEARGRRARGEPEPEPTDEGELPPVALN